MGRTALSFSCQLARCVGREGLVLQDSEIGGKSTELTWKKNQEMVSAIHSLLWCRGEEAKNNTYWATLWSCSSCVNRALLIYTISLAVTLLTCIVCKMLINSNRQFYLAVKDQEQWDFSPAGTSGDFGKAWVLTISGENPKYEESCSAHQKYQTLLTSP